MIPKIFIKILIVFVLMVPVALPLPVLAQNSNGFLNSLFGNGQRSRDRRAAESAQRQANREIQEALNYFEFDSGVVDGLIGRNTRAAISRFQQALDFPETGQLSTPEKDFLLSSYDLISNGNEDMNWRVLSNNEGTKGVLKSIYLEDNPFAQISVQPELLSQPSMRSFCINIDASGSINLVKTQFCINRQLAIEQAEFLAETSPNALNLEDIIVQCENFANAMSPLAAGLWQDSADTTFDQVKFWAATSGMASDTLARISKTCLGAGYATDNTDVALAAALALAGLGHASYVELIGYHVAFGLGNEGVNNFSTAIGWFENAINLLPGTSENLTGQDSDFRAALLFDVVDILMSN